MSYFLVRSFSLLAQRKRTKRKGSRSLGPAMRDCPALLETTGSLKLASLRQLNSCFGRFCGARRCEMAKPKQVSSVKSLLDISLKIAPQIREENIFL